MTATGFPSQKRHASPNVHFYQEMTPRSHGVRRAGSAALDMAYVAAGRYLTSAGHPVSCALHATVLSDSDGAPRAILSQIQDITDRKRHEEQLEFFADHDVLTGLLNRPPVAPGRPTPPQPGLSERAGRAAGGATTMAPAKSLFLASRLASPASVAGASGPRSTPCCS